MYFFVRNLAALVCGVSCFVACGGDDDDDLIGGGITNQVDGGADSGAAAPRGDAGGTGLADAGSDADAAPLPRPTGPGAPPTRSAPMNPDGDGFFEVHTQATGLSYWVRLPVGYVATTPYPMVLGAHGCGDTAQHFATWAIVPYDRRAEQAYVAVSLGGAEGGCWDPAQDEAKVLEVMDDVREVFYVHQKKVTIAGYSSGGQLAYYAGLRNAYRFAGILIENSAMPFADQTGAVLAAAEWKLNVALSSHTQDGSFPIATVHADRDLLQNAGFPIQFREVDGDHDGTSDEWHQWLLPKIDGFEAP